MADAATRWALWCGVAVPVVYYGVQFVAAPFFPGYSFLQTTASELGSDRSQCPVIFNVGIMLQGLASLAASAGFYLALRRLGGNPALAALTAATVAMSGVQHLWAGYFPLPDPRHAGHLPFIVAMTLLPVILTAALWRHGGRGLRSYLVGTLVLLAAFFLLRSGLSGLTRYEYRGLLQRVFTLTIFPPVGAGAWVLARRLRAEMGKA